MRLLAWLFGSDEGRDRARSLPGSDTCPDTTSTVEDTKYMVEDLAARHARLGIVTPARVASVDDWVPPERRKAPAKTQAEALVSLFQAEGRTGAVPYWDLVATYPEVAWLHGFVQLSERTILQALGQVCAKVRRDMTMDGVTMPKVVCYVIPAPAWADKGEAQPANVVAIGPRRRKRAQLGVQQGAHSGQRTFARLPKSGRQGKGGRHRADIGEAVACR